MRFRDKALLTARMIPHMRELSESNQLLSAVQDDLLRFERTDKVIRESALNTAWAKAAKVAKPGEVLDIYKRVLHSQAISGVFADFAGDFNEETRSMLGQAIMVNGLFYASAARLPQADIMPMIQLMRESSVLKKSAQLETTWSNGTAEYIFDGMGELVRNAPAEEKPRVYLAMDGDFYLPHRMPRQNAQAIASFVAGAFKDVDTETALRTLRHSQAWKAVKKDGKLAENLLEIDKRFYQAMDY